MYPYPTGHGQIIHAPTVIGANLWVFRLYKAFEETRPLQPYPTPGILSFVLVSEVDGPLH